MIKVLLADDHPMVRDALHSLLEKAGDMQVVATASDGQEAVSKAVVHCPHVAVMDISMPILNGIEATRQMCTRCPETRVLMVSGNNTAYYIQRSVEAGALGYVLKDAVPSDLVMAIRSLYEGNKYFSKQIAELAQVYTDY